VLQNEDELSLAFLHGQWPREFSTNNRVRPRFRGWVLRLFIHLLRLARGLFLAKKAGSNIEKKSCLNGVLVFAGTFNQYNALRSSALEISSIFPGTIFLYTGQIFDSANYPAVSAQVRFSWRMILVSLMLSVRRLNKLWSNLNSIDRRMLNWRLDTFLDSHRWLVYAWAILTEMKPRFLILSNDHNTPNRCLIAMAHHLGVKTVYLQHASVSSIFPALRFDFAFLDGFAALERYKECEQNSPRAVQTYPMPSVFLSGQKKHLSHDSKTFGNAIALAINTADESKTVIAFSKRMLDDDKNLIIRWHPSQSRSYVQTLKDALEGYLERVTFSDPLKQSLGEFFSYAQVMVSGNSSIHLDAALAGLRTIYFEWQNPPDTSGLNGFVKDYYGYVQAGLSDAASTVDEVLELCKHYSLEARQPDERAAAIRYFSETFGTLWEGREGELVAKTLAAINRSELDFDDFVRIKDDVFSDVWRLEQSTPL
jgi:hypothetical protein